MTTARESAGPIRLLVVDDEPDVKALFELRFRADLRRGQLDLQFATSGPEALERVRADPDIEVVITDLNMPGMDGLELLSRLDAHPLPIKTIVLTAYGDMTNIRTAMMRGAFDFQVKPLDIADLRTTIRKASAIVRQLRAGAAAQARAESLAEKNAFLERVFGQYVSEEVVSRLLAAPVSPTLQGERRALTLLMADIRGFTRLADELPAEGVVAVLNNYLELASEHILANGGTINEILGDGLLVFFGAPIDDPRAAEHAVAAAVGLQLAMGELNARHRAEGLPELAVGVAVHSGDAVVGTVGSDRRMKYAAVGRNVNVVGRIESHTRGGQILISETTYAAVRHLVAVSGQFRMRAKDIDEPLMLYAVRGIAGDYDLYLPQKTTVLREVRTGTAVQLSRVVDDRVGEPTSAVLIAIGRDAARLRTTLMLAPLDDARLDLESGPVYGKVSECALTDDGACELTLVFTSVARHALPGLDGDGG